jgi:formylglycine-generating enzyme required for sulfatase activity
MRSLAPPPRHLHCCRRKPETPPPPTIQAVNPADFQPNVVKIPAGGCCGYEFEAMRTPLTNIQYVTLCGARGVEDRRLYEPHLLGPWEWQGVGDQKHRYPQVAEEIKAILESCEQIANKPGYHWRVPTVAEWLRLAGCEDQSYPWGETMPSPVQANLKFERKIRRVQPVGSYPKGRSKYGADDCCGNIHELVWADALELLPESSRLMGGATSRGPSDRTPPAGGSVSSRGANRITAPMSICDW